MSIVEGLVIAACKAGVKKVVGGAVGIAAKHSTADIMGRQMNLAYEQTIRDVGLSAYNGVRALLAVHLKRDPADPEILGLMAEAAETAGFPARAVRLIEAARRSPSDRRREMLASVLYGLPFTDTEESDRERVDMLVERLMPHDVDLLNKIDALWESLSVADPNPRCLAIYWSGLRMIRYPVPASGYLSKDLMDHAPLASPTAFAALQSAGWG